MRCRRCAADASGGDEGQHDENIMRDIHIGQKRSETANEEQLDNLRKTVQFEQELQILHHLQPCMCLFGTGERQDRTGPVVVLNSGHVDDDLHISSLDVFYEMDGRKSRKTKEVLDWYEEDGGDLRRN